MRLPFKLRLVEHSLSGMVVMLYGNRFITSSLPNAVGTINHLLKRKGWALIGLRSDAISRKPALMPVASAPSLGQVPLIFVPHLRPGAPHLCGPLCLSSIKSSSLSVSHTKPDINILREGPACLEFPMSNPVLDMRLFRKSVWNAFKKYRRI